MYEAKGHHLLVDVFEGDVEGSDVGDRFAKVLGQQAALAELSGKFAEVS